MKKFLALVLALIMTFSLVSVAFAAEETTTVPGDETTVAPEEGADEGENGLGDFEWILDLPAESLKPALKIAKIFLKLVKVYYKICNAFGIDPEDGAAMIFDFIGNLVGNNGAEEETTDPVETTAAAVA